jgi:hypothetical protein
MTWAMVYVGHACAELCGGGVCHLIVKMTGAGNLTRHSELWPVLDEC